jgi:SAM-dependent methyltransferase
VPYENTMLQISEAEIRTHGPGRIFAVLLRQWRTELALTRRGVLFRSTDPSDVEASYAAMTKEEFDAINGPQAWANWRTIPRALHNHVLDRPLRVLDLGCGTGSSTMVLACYCPAGSRITGYEIAAPLLSIARQRDYRHKTGTPVSVDFVCQALTDRLPETDASVDLVNASGVIGHHLTPETIGPLIAELGRVLAKDGVAMLDVGPTMPKAELTRLMEGTGFMCLGHYRSWFGDRTGEVVFRRTVPV